MKYTVYLKGYNRPIIITDTNIKEQPVEHVKKLFSKAMAHGLTVVIETDNEVAIFKGSDIEGILIQGENNEKLLIDDIEETHENISKPEKSETILCVDLDDNNDENENKTLTDNINKNKKDSEND